MNSEIKGYEDLIAWQKAHRFAREILNVCRSLHGGYEAKVLKDQVLRSGLSIPSNIVEGFTGTPGKAYLNYLRISRRSCQETGYWLLLLSEEGYIPREMYRQLKQQCQEVNAILTGLIRAIGKRLSGD